ncbi:outer membrane protein [Sphingomonas sp. CJ20]
MRINTLAGAAFGALMFAVAAVPAQAQTTDVPQDKEFQGAYAGGSFGYTVQSNSRRDRVTFDRGLDGGFGDTVTTVDGSNAFANGFCHGRATSASRDTGCDNRRDDIEYHGRIGYDVQFGRVVVGALAEFGKTEATDSVTAFSSTPASYTLTRGIDWDASVRARIGYAVGPRTLFYGTGGPSYAKISRGFATTNTTNNFELIDQNKKSWGYTAGGGVEQKIGRNFSVGLEYLYSSYKDDDFRVRATQGAALPTNPFVLNGAAGTDMARNNRFDYHAMRATAAFRF